MSLFSATDLSIGGYEITAEANFLFLRHLDPRRGCWLLVSGPPWPWPRFGPQNAPQGASRTPAASACPSVSSLHHSLPSFPDLAPGLPRPPQPRQPHSNAARAAARGCINNAWFLG